jgi:hypothetical protein
MVQATLGDWRISTGRKQIDSQLHRNTTNTTDQPNHNRKLQQQVINIEGKNQFDIWGHELYEKNDNVIRIAFRNMNSLPQDKAHNKNNIFLHEIRQTQADIYIVPTKLI